MTISKFQLISKCELQSIKVSDLIFRIPYDMLGHEALSCSKSIDKNFT